MGKPFSVVRRRTLSAPVDRVYPHVNDLAKWVDWSPWEGLDPDLARTYSDETAGPGAHYTWSGNRKVGQGSMTIIEADENERVVIDLKFLAPFKAENITTFDFAEVDGGTEVTWTMTGELNLFMRLMGIFMPMDKMVGPDFEKGLAQLAGVVEN